MAEKVSLEILKRSLIKRNEDGESWAGMGREYEVNPAVLWRIANENYNPKKAELRAKLGLHELVTMEIHRNSDGFKLEQTV